MKKIKKQIKKINKKYEQNLYLLALQITSCIKEYDDLSMKYAYSKE